MSFSQYHAYHFYSSAIRSTAIEKSVSGHFTSPLDLNLIVAKNSRLELFVVGPQGLTQIKEIKIYGKISVMFLFRPKNSLKDSLFILTTRYNAMILESKGEIEALDIFTRAHGNVADTVGRVCENGLIAIIDPEARVIGLRLYDGLLKIIPLESVNNELKAVNIRLEETEIQDIHFLHGCVNPTIILLHQDILGRHIKTHEICLREMEFTKTAWKQDNIETGASMIIPVPEPVCGALIIGQESILYHNGTYFIAVAPPVIRKSTINCFGQIDSMGRRYVLGDMAGHLFMVFLEIEEKIDSTFSVRDIKVELLGEITIPECITYLDNGVLFIASRIGDSQLVQLDGGLSPETGSYVTILETFTNLAPIVDMIVVDLEKIGQFQLITCSGGFKEGSLRLIRNGIGLQRNATVELPGIKDMWSLKINIEHNRQDILVLSFVGHTRVLSLVGEDVEETEMFDINSEDETLFCGSISLNAILQVIPRCVRLVCLEPKYIVSEWMLSLDRKINLVAANNHQIICVSGADIFYLQIFNTKIVERKRTQMEQEISCVDISPFSDDTLSNYVSVGLWNDMSVRILSLPSLEEVDRINLGGEIISRSLLFASFEGMDYLFCGMGDGSLFYLTFNRTVGKLNKKKHVKLGTQPIRMRTFKTVGIGNIFVCSDRPTVIYCSNQKLVFSNVNLKEVNNVCPLNTDAYPDNLAFTSNNVLSFGTMEEIQKLHITSIPLQEAPRRIAYQEYSQSFGVITCRIDVQGPTGAEIQRECASSRAQITSNSQHSSLMVTKKVSDQLIEDGTELEIHHFLLIDQHTFEILHAHQMLPNEYALSLISCKLRNDPNSYYVVGTALVNAEDYEPKLGRIIVFHVDDGKLTMVCEKEVKGGCYSLAEFNGKLLASINSSVRLFEWTSEKELRLECSHFNNIVALFVKTKGDFILIGDLMRAVTLLQYKTVEGSFEEIARDYNPNWMTAIEILDDDTFLGAENAFNLFVCQKDSTATSDEDRQFMIEVAQFHLGDMVNIFRAGSLNLQPINDTSARSILFGTVSGAIGTITHISPELFDLFNEIQKRLAVVIKSAGKISHSFWRSFSSEIKTEPAVGFIDGELMECFLDLNRKDMEDTVEGLKCPFSQEGGGDYEGFRREMQSGVSTKEFTVDTVIKIIEDLTSFR